MTDDGFKDLKVYEKIRRFYALPAETTMPAAMVDLLDRLDDRADGTDLAGTPSLVRARSAYRPLGRQGRHDA